MNPRRTQFARKLIAYFGVVLVGLLVDCRPDQKQKQAALPANPDGVKRVRISQFFMDTQDSLVYDLTEASITVVWHRYQNDFKKRQPYSVVFKKKLSPAQRFLRWARLTLRNGPIIIAVLPMA